MKKIPLQLREHPPSASTRAMCIDWEKAPAFNANPRGELIHRIRSGRTHLWDGEIHHHSVDYWCANGTCGEGVELTDDPPRGRLLCLRCEMLAVAAGQIPADKLIGRHIHLGTIKVQRECCRNDHN